MPICADESDANLNKGEARNALPRAVFFNRLGGLRDRTFENQRHRACGLNLIVSAIILWNTVYLDRAARHRRERGLTGDYRWSEIGNPRERFRPLRTTRSAICP